MATLKVLCKNGLQVMTDSFDAYKVSSSAPIFLAVESVFSKWLKDSNPANEYHEMYFGEDAIYTVRGAIIGGIGNIIEYMTENNLTYITTRAFKDIDIEAAFE